YWKMDATEGTVNCLFRSETGSVGVGSGRDLMDGEWHSVRCERTAAGVTMEVDGEVVDDRKGETGHISNDMQLTIGGKSACDQVTVGCDYFSGEIAFVRVEGDPEAG